MKHCWYPEEIKPLIHSGKHIVFVMSVENTSPAVLQNLNDTFEDYSYIEPLHDLSYTQKTAVHMFISSRAPEFYGNSMSTFSRGVSMLRHNLGYDALTYDCAHRELHSQSPHKYMTSMFHTCKEFNQPLIKWDVSNVEDMEDMFHDAHSFNQPLDKWDVSTVFEMGDMFNCAESFNQPLASWNTSNLKNMENMFFSCRQFNQPLNNWDVSKVNSMQHMFYFCDKFNQQLDSWDVSKVTNMCGMFENCYKFNQPLNDWNLSNVENIIGMFERASSFNQNLNSWLIKDTCFWTDAFNHAELFNYQENATWYNPDNRYRIDPGWSSSDEEIGAGPDGDY